LKIRIFALAVALLTVTAFSPQTARAGGVWTVNVHNETGHCAWITLYHAHGFNPTGWEIAGVGWAPAKKETTFRVNAWVELKVRAEVKSGGCANTANIADTYDERARYRDMDGTFDAQLIRQNTGRLQLWFLK